MHMYVVHMCTLIYSISSMCKTHYIGNELKTRFLVGSWHWLVKGVQGCVYIIIDIMECCNDLCVYSKAHFIIVLGHMIQGHTPFVATMQSCCIFYTLYHL